MEYLEQKIRELATLRKTEDAWEAGAALGDLLEQLARDARCRDLNIDRVSRFALSPSAAWMDLTLTGPDGSFVRLEVGKGRA